MQNSSKNPNPGSKWKLATSGATHVPLGNTSKSANIANFQKTQNPHGLISGSNAYFAKQKFLRHEVSTKFAHLQGYGHTSQIEPSDGSKVAHPLNFDVFEK